MGHVEAGNGEIEAEHVKENTSILIRSVGSAYASALPNFFLKSFSFFFD